MFVSTDVVRGERVVLQPPSCDPIVDRFGEEGGVDARIVHAVSRPGVLVQRRVPDQRPSRPNRNSDQMIPRPTPEEASLERTQAEARASPGWASIRSLNTGSAARRIAAKSWRFTETATQVVPPSLGNA